MRVVSGMVLTAAVLAALVAGRSVPGHAQVAHAQVAQKSPPGDALTQSIQIYDALVSFPPASWYTGGDPADSSVFERNQKGPLFVFRQFPKGQNSLTWSRVYALTGYRVPPPKPVALDDVVAGAVASYVRMCGPKRTFSRTIAADTNSRTLIIHCESTGPASGQPGYGPSVGEVALMRLFAVGRTLVQAVHVWRGNLFLQPDETTWPVDRAELDLMIDRFAQLRVWPGR